ncbi:MAG: hypothetical protein FJ096_13080 [Deltaproteobacteria bacterium]|nr:hypothetical protein [Deltaproteobacteria bacterium]
MMSIAKLAIHTVAAAALLGAIAACHDEPPPQVPPPPPPAPTPTVTAPPPPTDTAAVPPPPVTMQPCDANMQLALQTALKAREKTELGGGMKPESGFTCMFLPEGGVASVPIMLQSGGCYTFLAQSFPNVAEVDIVLKPNFGSPVPPLLAMFANTPFVQDSDVGPAATVGKGTQCFKNPLPIPGMAIVEVKARTGSGPVALQVYSK